MPTYYRSPLVVARVGNASDGYVDVSDDVVSLTIDLGIDVVSSSCTLVLKERPSGLDFLQQVWVSLGYSPYTIPVYRGHVEDEGLRAFPYDDTLRAAGAMRLAQHPWGAASTDPDDKLEYGAASSIPGLRTLRTDGAIVKDLLAKAGAGTDFSAPSIDDAGLTLGSQWPVTLKAGQAPAALIKDIDQIAGYWTGDGRDGGIIRRRISGAPARAACWTYTEGSNILACERVRSVAKLANAVRVRGRKDADEEPLGTASDSDPYSYVWDPPGYIVHELRSDVIDTQALADTVATRLLSDVLRVPDELQLEVPGNPFLAPAATVNVLAPSLRLYSATPYLIVHLQHVLRPDRYETHLKLRGYPLGTDYTAPVALAPSARFAVTLASGVYTVVGDASGSTDPSGDPTTLQYAWAVSGGSNFTVSGTWMSVDFTAAQMSAGTYTILLEVKASDGRQASRAYPVALGQL